MPENFISKDVERIIHRKIFESDTALSPEVESWLNSCTNGTWVLDSETGKVKVDGDFDCSYQDLTDFKGVKFSKVTGNFNCETNDLVSLEGSPDIVGNNFDCRENLLVNLVGGPNEVGGSYDCSWNKLTSLEGAPEVFFSKTFNCSHNRLKSLEFCPQKPSSLNCSANRLESLKYGPTNINHSYNCSVNLISSFEGFPIVVGGNFNLSKNKFTTLEGMPQMIGGDLNFSENAISSIFGARIPDRGNLILTGNSVPKEQITLLNSFQNVMKRVGLNLVECMLLNGTNWTNIKVKFDEKYKSPKPESGTWDKLSKTQQKENIMAVKALTDSPKQFYDLIQSLPDRLQILASVRNETPRVWDTIKDFGKAKLSAEAGDLYF